MLNKLIIFNLKLILTIILFIKKIILSTIPITSLTNFYKFFIIFSSFLS